MDSVCIEMGEPLVTVQPTHLYVRFLPKDSTEYNRLLDSSNLMLFGYPLDRSLTDEEVITFENDTTDTYGYPWQYTKVPTDYVFPEEIIHEVLDEVVVETFSDDDINKGTSVNTMSASKWDRVLTKSMRIPTQTRASYNWRPYAKITYVDDFNGETIPLVGVRVRCHHLLHFDVSYTNAAGEATQFGTFKKAVRYKIFWEDRNYWDIRDGFLRQAKTQGPEYSAPWMLTIAGDTQDAMYAAIHRGCRAIYYDNPFGIINPYSGNRMKLCAYFDKNEEKNGDYFGYLSLVWPEIRIFRKNDEKTRARWQMTSTTIHELGHASHFRGVVRLPGANRITHFKNADDKLVETWARGIQYAFMNWLYPNQIEDIRPKYYGDYTGVVEGLLNQGLTLKQIETTVVGTQTWNEWRSIVKSLGLIDHVIVDMIFDNPLMPWTVNFKDLVIGTSQIYTGMDVTYSIPVIKSESLGIDVSLSNWTISGDGYTILQDDRINRSIKLRFNTLGERTLTAQIKLPNGTIYAVNQKIKVSSRGFMSGSTRPQTGVPTTFTLTNYSGTVDKWVFDDLTPRNYWIESTTYNSVKVVFKTPCTTTVRALIQKNELAVKSVTVPQDASIAAFIAMKNRDFPNDYYLHITIDGVLPNYVTKKGLRDPEPKTSKMHFMAYITQPSESHPNYSHLKPIYESGFYHDKYAYFDAIFHDFSKYGVKAWVFSTQRPNTVPLYCVMYNKVDDKNIIQGICYLTLENVSSWRKVTSWYWNWLGTKKTGDRDWTEQRNVGIVGYVYPYKPQD